MQTAIEKLLHKLDRPPAGPNWVRFIRADEVKTAKAILSFVRSRPPFNYLPGYTAIKDRIELGIELETARGVALTKGSPAGRTQNLEFVEAFFDYDEVRGFSAQNAVGFERGHFMVSRDVKVPVSPLSVIREKGEFVPIFVCGWNSNPLDLTQRRLLATIWDDGFLSLTDYEQSPAEFLFFPKGNESRDRADEVWKRGDYELLSQEKLDEQLQIFLLGRELARSLLMEEATKPSKHAPTADVSETLRRQKDLFDDE